jgi:asparagine synthase (glutamine-hydrolysing)
MGLPDDATGVLRRMTTAIAHRGPDDSGEQCDSGAGFAVGHRRLSIIDTSASGHQPMTSHSGRYVLAFNGEIYNFRELRERLNGEGVSFRGSSDTEVLLEAIERWGLGEAIRSAAGMFAFGVWDTKQRTLHLGRDRIGEKPLYYGWAGDTLLFGSELKALRQHPEWRGDIDRGALALYLRFSYVPAPYCIYTGFNKVRPGTILTFRGSTPRAEPELDEYWSARQVVEEGLRNPWRMSENELIDACERRLSDTIREQMISDVPLGAFLSGGIDSSIVVALMQRLSSRPVKTFTIGFGVAEYNEAEHARNVATHLGTEHTELYVTPEEALQVIPRLPTMYDEPFADSSQIPTYLVAQLARSRVTVALSGDGGDEVFGGYHRYVWAERLRRKFRLVPPSVRGVMARGIRTLSPRQWNSIFARGRRVLPTSVSIPGERMHKLANVMTATSAEQLYAQLVSQWPEPTLVSPGIVEPSTILTDTERWAGFDEFAQRMMYMDLVSYLPDDIMVKVDRATMAVSLESRAPFLDHRVIEFAWRVPQESKIRNGTTKWLLRQILYRHIPQSLVDRPKMGFGIPLEYWLRGELREWAGDLIDSDRLKRDGYFDAAVVGEKWQEHQSGSRNWQHLLWNILMFQAWLENQ